MITTLPSWPVNLSCLKSEIKDNFGKKCKDFSILCSTCQAWRAYETLAELFEINEKAKKKK